MKHPHLNQNGVTLVSALLVMALVSAIAIGLAVTILNHVNTTRDINYAVSAFYSADSSLEQGLWIIQQARRDNLSLQETLAKLNAEGSLDPEAVPNPKTVWKRTAAEKNETVSYDLGAEQEASVELYNPDQLTPGYTDAPQYIKVSWVDPTGQAKVQVSWIGWVANGGYIGGNGQFYPYDNGTTVNIVDPALPTRIYLRIKAKDGGVANLTVESFKYDGSQIDIPSQIALTATGEFPAGGISSKQALSASVPWLLPISGLYSYVLYSEDPINKP
jgi:Tfp pilus assembly protein PilX